MNTRRLCTVGRVIWGALALVLLAFGVKSLFDGKQLRDDFEHWQTAKPMDGPIDFSRPGRFVLPLNQTCSSSHGETVALRVPAEVLQGTTVTQLRAGLAAKLDISDKTGSNLVVSATTDLMLGEEPFDGTIPIFSLTPFRKGVYDATITVTEGAPALKGISQRIEGRYLLCGLERMPAAVATVMGAVSTLIGCVVGFGVAFRAARDRSHDTASLELLSTSSPQESEKSSP